MWSDRPVVAIGDVGLSTDASHALHSMLQIIRGRSATAWELSAPSRANVLLVGHDALDSTLRTPDLATKLLIVVVDDRAAPSHMPFVLRYPFRVMQLLDLLDDVAGHLQRHDTDDAPWATAHALRKASQQATARGWQVAQAGNDARIWLDADSVRTDERTLRQLCAEPLEIGPFVASEQAPPPESLRCSRADACWHVGLHAPDALPPWLDPETSYGLRRWPDLGRLGAPAPLLDLCADLAMRPHTPAELLQRTTYDTAPVHHFLAAASLAGYLAGQERDIHRSGNTGSAPLRGWARFITELRKHLT